LFGIGTILPLQEARRERIKRRRRRRRRKGEDQSM
jgi:hypothetical protein